MEVTIEPKKSFPSEKTKSIKADRRRSLLNKLKTIIKSSRDKMNSKQIEIFNTIAKDKYFGYQVKMAIVLLSPKEAYEILEEKNKQPMLREGEPSAVWECILKDEIYETKAWYIPDHLKIWDRRFGKLFSRPFFAFDDDVESWTSILEFYIRVSTPQMEDYPNQKIHNRDWAFFAEILAVAQKNKHPLFEKAYEVLQGKGLPQKVWEKKQAELEAFTQLEHTEKGIAHFSRITNW